MIALPVYGKIRYHESRCEFPIHKKMSASECSYCLCTANNIKDLSQVDRHAILTLLGYCTNERDITCEARNGQWCSQSRFRLSGIMNCPRALCYHADRMSFPFFPDQVFFLGAGRHRQAQTRKSVEAPYRSQCQQQFVI